MYKLTIFLDAVGILSCSLRRAVLCTSSPLLPVTQLLISMPYFDDDFMLSAKEKVTFCYGPRLDR